MPAVEQNEGKSAIKQRCLPTNDSNGIKIKVANDRVGYVFAYIAGLQKFGLFYSGLMKKAAARERIEAWAKEMGDQIYPYMSTLMVWQLSRLNRNDGFYG